MFNPSELLKDKLKEDKKVKLHLGCSEKKIYDFLNIDIREEVKPDIVDDIFKLEKFGKESVDLIYACHVLEHADFKQAKETLNRWCEILKPGGKLRIAIPDIEKVCAALLFYKDMKYLRSAFWRAVNVILSIIIKVGGLLRH